MTIFDLFSQRKKDATQKEKFDVYQYDNIPKNLRVQVIQIALEALGLVSIPVENYITFDVDNSENLGWIFVKKTFLREKGLFKIGNSGDFAGTQVIEFMCDCTTTDWLDLLELITIAIKQTKNRNPREIAQWQVTLSANDAINELNYRLRRAGVGYQIEDSQLVQIDNQFIHAEIVQPALILLSGKGFKGPREEFLSAHKHYRSGEYRPAVAMAANAFESTLKAIFEQKKWDYKKGARISDLIKVARQHHLWPDYLDNSFDQFVATLQNGLPKIRDNTASHGQGAQAKELPSYIAAYALHLAACNIVFTVEAARQTLD